MIANTVLLGSFNSNVHNSQRSSIQLAVNLCHRRKLTKNRTDSPIIVLDETLMFVELYTKWIGLDFKLILLYKGRHPHSFLRHLTYAIDLCLRDITKRVLCRLTLVKRVLKLVYGQQY